MGSKIKDLAESSKVMVFEHANDKSASTVIGAYTTDYTVHDLGSGDGNEIEEALKSGYGGVVPAVFIDGKFFGGVKQLNNAAQDGSLVKKLQEAMVNMSEKPSKQPLASDVSANAPRGPDLDYHQNKHRGAD